MRLGVFSSDFGEYVMVEVDSRDRKTGRFMMLNTGVSLGGDGRLLSLTLYISSFSSEGLLTIVGHESLVSNGWYSTMFAGLSVNEREGSLRLASGSGSTTGGYGSLIDGSGRSAK